VSSTAPHQHRQHGRLAIADGDVVVGETTGPTGTVRLALGTRVRPKASGTFKARAQLSHALTSTVMPRVQPIRSATTWRACPASPPQPPDSRLEAVHRRACVPPLVSSARSYGAKCQTERCLRATPNLRAIALMRHSPRPCASLLISAHSSTLITFLLPFGPMWPSQDRVQTTESGGSSGGGQF